MRERRRNDAMARIPVGMAIIAFFLSLNIKGVQPAGIPDGIGSTAPVVLLTPNRSASPVTPSSSGGAPSLIPASSPANSASSPAVSLIPSSASNSSASVEMARATSIPSQPSGAIASASAIASGSSVAAPSSSLSTGGIGGTTMPLSLVAASSSSSPISASSSSPSSASSSTPISASSSSPVSSSSSSPVSSSSSSPVSSSSSSPVSASSLSPTLLPASATSSAAAPSSPVSASSPSPTLLPASGSLSSSSAAAPTSGIGGSLPLPSSMPAPRIPGGSAGLINLTVASSPGINIPSELSSSPPPNVSIASPNSSATPAACGVVITYDTTNLVTSSNGRQSFSALMNVTNNGQNPLRGWTVTIMFQWNEMISSVTGLYVYSPALGSGRAFPDGMTLTPEIGVTDPLVGASAGVLSSPVSVSISGTLGGVFTKKFAVPSAITLNSTSQLYACGQPNATDTGIQVCCTESMAPAKDPLKQMPGNTSEYTGISIFWDVIVNAQTFYTVLIRVKNVDPYKTIASTDYSCPTAGDPRTGWCISFQWDNNEYISGVRRCATTYKGVCSDLQQFTDLKNLTSAYSCDRNPCLIDANDARDGALSPEFFDPSAAMADMELDVGKQQADWGPEGGFSLPSNFSIGLPGYVCSTPQVMEPNKLPVPNEPRQMMSALGSWSISCGPGPTVTSSKQCCVSLSGIYNKTLAPCMSCACSVLSPCTQTQPPCDSAAPATTQQAFGEILGQSQNDYTIPPVPKKMRACTSGCGQQIHFHLSKIENGIWTIDAKLDNELNLDKDNWMVAVQFQPNVSAALIQVFSVNYTAPDSSGMIVFYGFRYFNEILKANGGIAWQMVFNSSIMTAQLLGIDPLLLGPNQDLTDKQVLATRVDQRMLPTRVLLMGEECAMPDQQYIPSLPINPAMRLTPSVRWRPLTFVIVFALIFSSAFVS